MSKNIIHKNRNGCVLQGALKVVNAIDGLLPIIHSSAGCSIHSKLSNSTLTGNNGAHFSGWLETPSTSVIEKEIVFGGSSRLREQIKNTIKIQSADLYVVISGCAPEIVGDDVSAMVKEAQEQDFPVINVSAPGFKGNVFKGYQLAVKSLIERILAHELTYKTEENRVNLLGIIPEQDIFWEGNLESLKALLTCIGLNANTLLGYNQNEENWNAVPLAGLNIVFSIWGLEAAQQLEKKIGTPYLYIGYLPTGATDTSAFLDAVGAKTGISTEVIEKVKSDNEKYQYYQFQKLAQCYHTLDLQKEIILVGESHNILGIARFLQNSFGQLIKAVIVTDNPAEEYRDQIKDLLPVNDFYPIQLIFTVDGKEIDEYIYDLKPELILGSSLEQPIAHELSVPLIKVSAPAFDKVIVDSSYTGYKGALALLQEFSNAFQSAF